MTSDVDLAFSSLEVCQMVGISYRQLDHWLRVGTITIDRALPGSGSPRRWTLEEVDRLREIVAIYREALDAIEAFRSGALWRSTDLPT